MYVSSKKECLVFDKPIIFNDGFDCVAVFLVIFLELGALHI